MNKNNSKFYRRWASVELKNTTLSIKIAKNVQNTDEVKICWIS